MPYVFVSSAEEDKPAARRIVDRLQLEGVRVFWFLDEQNRGRRFLREIELAIAEADLFLVLLSPSYLNSGWCRQERDLAVQREVDLASQQSGTFTQRVAANDESGVRDGRYLLVASPDEAADQDLALSLSSDQAKDDRYPDGKRTALQLGNVEIATSADLHQACP